MQKYGIAYFTMVTMFLGGGAAYHYDMLPESSDLESEVNENFLQFNDWFIVNSSDCLERTVQVRFEWRVPYGVSVQAVVDGIVDVDSNDWYSQTPIALRGRISNSLRKHCDDYPAIELPQEVARGLNIWKVRAEKRGVEFRNWQWQLSLNTVVRPLPTKKSQEDQQGLGTKQVTKGE